MRAFIAIEIPSEVKDSLLAVSERLRRIVPGATWVKREAMHLTLVFLGEIGGAAAIEVADALRNSCCTLPRTQLHVRGLGAFPNMRKPSVVWAGVEPLDGPLTAIHYSAETAAAVVSVKPENRPYRAHITLARIRHPGYDRQLSIAIEREAGFDAGAFTASAVSLFTSELTRQGPVYTCLEEFPLL